MSSSRAPRSGLVQQSDGANSGKCLGSCWRRHRAIYLEAHIFGIRQKNDPNSLHKMKSKLRLIIAFLFGLAVFDVSAMEPSPSGVPKERIEFNELGIVLYGIFRFESEGELFAVIDGKSTILVPVGAVLTCIRPAYAIGYFSGGAAVVNGGATRALAKIFFILKPSGEVTFHETSPDGNFPGAQVVGSVVFGILYRR
jgi:hypothetical protein